MAKGKIAQLESDKMGLQEGFSVLESVAAAMKAALTKATLTKKLVFDKQEQIVFDNLLAAQ